MSKIHILGIAGHAMRGVAYAAKQLGNEVAGTDEFAYSPGTEQLAEWGIPLYTEPDSSHLDGVDTLVIGGAVVSDHPELLQARSKGIKVSSYPEFVASLIKDERRIVVAGTHGKTTTTSLIAWILDSAGRKPDFLVGIQPNNFDSSVRLQHGDIAVLEGDEYRSSRLDTSSKFSHYRADVAVITSIEMDHPDLFADLAAVEERFEGLVRTLPPKGKLVYWSGSSEVRMAAAKSSAPTESYDLEDADWTAEDVDFTPAGIEFNLMNHEQDLGRIQVATFGQHNVLNALAAAAVTLGEGVSFDQLSQATSTFRGASRRFELVSKPDAKVMVIDDYAHHPTEVAATINAAKLHFDGRVIAVFRPHTYSRTASLMGEYQLAFEEADKAFIAEIEGAREQGSGGQPDDGEKVTSSAEIAEGAGPNVVFEPDRAKLIEAVLVEAKPGDVVLCMTVNGYRGLAQELADKLS